MNDTYNFNTQGGTGITQIGKVEGDVKNLHRHSRNASDGRADLAVMLDDLRRDIRNALANGDVNARDAEAFEDVLNEANGYLPVTSEDGKTRFLVAMKKAKGLVEDLAGVAAKLAAAVAAARGMT